MRRKIITSALAERQCRRFIDEYGELAQFTLQKIEEILQRRERFPWVMPSGPDAGTLGVEVNECGYAIACTASIVASNDAVLWKSLRWRVTENKAAAQ